MYLVNNSVHPLFDSQSGLCYNLCTSPEEAKVDIVFYILVGGSIVLGLLLALAGLYGLIKGETYGVDKETNAAKMIEGKEARRMSLFYFIGGGIWFLYGLYRLLGKG
jgi:hypothetical protein